MRYNSRLNKIWRRIYYNMIYPLSFIPYNIRMTILRIKFTWFMFKLFNSPSQLLYANDGILILVKEYLTFLSEYIEKNREDIFYCEMNEEIILDMKDVIESCDRILKDEYHETLGYIYGQMIFIPSHSHKDCYEKLDDLTPEQHEFNYNVVKQSLKMKNDDYMNIVRILLKGKKHNAGVLSWSF